MYEIQLKKRSIIRNLTYQSKFKKKRNTKKI